MAKKYIAQKINTLVNEKIQKLQKTELTSPKYILWKEKHRDLAVHFDQAINNFFENDLRQEINKMKLSKNLQKEIYLFDWVKANGYDWLVNNYEKVQKFLFVVQAEFYTKLNFYAYRFSQQGCNQNIVFADFLMSWESLLIKNAINYHFLQIETFRKKFSEELFNRVEIFQEANKLLKTVWNFFGILWNPKDVYNLNLDFKIIERFASFLEHNPNILELAKLLGRFQGISNLIEERISEKIVIEYEMRKVGSLPEEVIGATESDVLEHVLPSEFVYLNNPTLKYIFYKKFLEKKLVSLEFLSLDEVPVEKTKFEIIEKPVPEDEGPIILCIDTSSSMQGTAEQIAKAISLAVIKIANSTKRPCYMINFGSTLEVYNFTNIKGSLDKLIQFLSYSFNNNTNLEPAVEHALMVMNSNDYFNADLLIVSDLIVEDFSPWIKKQIAILQSRRNRFNALSIGTNLNKKIAPYFNNVWVYDPLNPLASDKIIGTIIKTFDKKYQKYVFSSDLIIS